MFIFFVPVQTWLYTRDRLKRGRARPEARFLLSIVTVWGFPASLFWFAFTSNGKTNFWSPVIAGGLLGVADPLLWLSMLSYITDSYPNVAASAIAAFLIPSFALAAGCVHIGMICRINVRREALTDIFPRYCHVRQPVHHLGLCHPGVHLAGYCCPGLRALFLWTPAAGEVEARKEDCLDQRCGRRDI
jgi:hypothetical protein